MADRDRPPRLQPPPRVGAAEPALARAEDTEHSARASVRRRALFGTVFAAMIIGLIGVFFVLPRWQTQRMSMAEATPDLRTAGSTPLSEAHSAPTPTAEPDSTEPRALPIPTRANSRPAPVRAARQPTRGPSSSEKDFAAAMSAGLQAIDRGQWEAASTALDRAARINPNAPEVADALAQVQAKQRRATIANGIRHALELEEVEKWREATDAYSAVLAADPESAAALDGHERASKRADLDEKLEYHLRNPGRLTTPSVLEDATALLEEAKGAEPGGPRLAAQTNRLGALVELASEPLPVTLESDNLTEITVYQVGRLGAFTTRQLKLRPGTYTAVGSRAGYRDVRVRFAVMPGAPIEPIVIRCAESL